jgi:hypothetical protein
MRDLRSQQLPLGLWCKYPSEDACEAVTMHFILSNTSIQLSTIMDFVPGNELTGSREDYLILTTISSTHPCLARYTQPQWDPLGKQIHACINQLHAFHVPGPEICTFGGEHTTTSNRDGT